MRLFFIGSLPEVDGGANAFTADQARASLQAIGVQVATNDHQLIVCSPFPGSADLEVIRGAVDAGLKAVEIHYPSDPEVHKRVTAMAREFGVELREFVHPRMERVDERSNSYAWLLAQLAAFDASDIIVAAGGRLGGSASMLLRQAEAKQRPMAPLGHLGGAAAAALERQRYRLLDRLGPLSAWLQNPDPAEKLQKVIDALVSGGGHASRRDADEAPRVFISYARLRPQEADLAEMTLRRRGLEVFRDEHDFAPGAHLMGEIEEHLARCDVFVALWSRDYACSPWCYDELATALRRAKVSKMQLWLLRVDDIRIVPPGARELTAYDCFDRQRLTSTLANLSDRLTS